MRKHRPKRFRGRHFQDDIMSCVFDGIGGIRSAYRDLEEQMAERGLSVDHSTVARCVLRHAKIRSDGLQTHQQQWVTY